MTELCVGDVVLAGAGIAAELRSFPPGRDGMVVVRWLNPGGHHSRVPWSTVKPIGEK